MQGKNMSKAHHLLDFMRVNNQTKAIHLRTWEGMFKTTKQKPSVEHRGK
jgi:hypothetical protein